MADRLYAPLPPGVVLPWFPLLWAGSALGGVVLSNTHRYAWAILAASSVGIAVTAVTDHLSRQRAKNERGRAVSSIWEALGRSGRWACIWLPALFAVARAVVLDQVGVKGPANFALVWWLFFATSLFPHLLLHFRDPGTTATAR